MVPAPEGDRTMASLWGEAGELGRSVLGRERDPEKSVWPESGRATDPNPVDSLPCGGACLGSGVFVSLKRNLRELLRASVDVC